MQVYSSLEQIYGRFPIFEEDQRFCQNIEQKGGLPFRLTERMVSLLEILSREDPDSFLAMYRQCIPSYNESHILDCELSDPLGAHRYQVCHRLVHQYENRCLLLTTARCFSYCRHCFRRCYAVQREGFIPEEELEPVCQYLCEHEEIQEILCSGGDPLTAKDDKLAWLFSRIRKVRSDILIRVCTRAPVFFPERFTPQFLSLLRSFRPLWVIPHINHPAEISPLYSRNTVSVFASLLNAGIPMQSQTVLLRGVNDSPAILAALFQQLVTMGIKPGYLFQGDLAPGTGHFRVPPKEGLVIYGKLRKLLSGLSCPVYAVDLPDGGGKFNMLQLDSDFNDIDVKKENSGYRFSNEKGSWYYPY